MPPTVGARPAIVGGPGAVLRTTALALWPASVIPQSSTLSRTLLPLIVLNAVGPNSSVTRMPPALLLTVFSSTCECVTDIRCSPSPQSPGTTPSGAHSPTGLTALPPRSLLLTVFSLIVTFVVLIARMPSKLAFRTTKPLTDDPAALGPVTRTPLPSPVASITGLSDELDVLGDLDFFAVGAACHADLGALVRLGDRAGDRLARLRLSARCVLLALSRHVEGAAGGLCIACRGGGAHRQYARQGHGHSECSDVDARTLGAARCVALHLLPFVRKADAVRSSPISACDRTSTQLAALQRCNAGPTGRILSAVDARGPALACAAAVEQVFQGSGGAGRVCTKSILETNVTLDGR